MTSAAVKDHVLCMYVICSSYKIEHLLSDSKNFAVSKHHRMPELRPSPPRVPAPVRAPAVPQQIAGTGAVSWVLGLGRDGLLSVPPGEPLQQHLPAAPFRIMWFQKCALMQRGKWMARSLFSQSARSVWCARNCEENIKWYDVLFWIYIYNWFN